MTRVLRIGLLGLVAVSLAACAPSTSSISKDTGVPATPTVEVTSSFNGSELHTAMGHLLHLVLEGQGWTFTASPSSLVSVETPSSGSIPPECSGPRQTQSCGTTSITYLAKAIGTVTLRATRTMCGEARRCVGSEGDYFVTVVIGRGVSAR